MPEELELLPVVYCPVCCTNLDAEGMGDQSFECPTCETTFTVVLEAEKIASHAPIG